MTAYAIGHLREVRIGPDIVEYLHRIDATLAPFEGRFIIHGGPKVVLEGDWPGDLIVIAFPNVESANGWYHSPAHQEIVRLRTDNSQGGVLIMDGVDADHQAPDVLSS
jgi:uncharacterized protein (DUF1330 family)